MKQTKIFIGIIAVTIFVVGSVVIITKQQTKDTQTTMASLKGGSVAQMQETNTTTTLPTTAQPSQTNTSPIPSSYTLSQVQVHNSRTSCWSIVNGNVYDLTSWINSHPGGENEILSICGKDGSRDFNGEHSGDKKPANMLAQFKIGVLKN